MVILRYTPGMYADDKILNSQFIVERCFCNNRSVHQYRLTKYDTYATIGFRRISRAANVNAKSKIFYNNYVTRRVLFTFAKLSSAVNHRLSLFVSEVIYIKYNIHCTCTFNYIIQGYTDHVPDGDRYSQESNNSPVPVHARIKRICDHCSTALLCI